MENGMIIEVKGIVEWSFHIVNHKLIGKYECYYVPDWKVWLINPQRFFKRSNGITGEFVCNKDNAQLNFRGHPVLKIDYDSKNNLPTATAHNYVIDSPSINLCITVGKDQNISPATKRLLQWHSWFGYRNLRDTQLILRSPRFGTYKFLSSSKTPFEKHPKY